MQKDRSYILFLKEYKSRGFKGENTVFVPTTTVLSRYACDNREIKIFSEEQLVNERFFLYYNEVKENEVLLFDAQLYEKFVQMKQDTGNLLSGKEL